MTELNLSIFDPNTLLPHRAGIAGLGLALSVLEPNSAPLKWEVTEDSVNLSWDCTDKEAISWLLEQTYQIKDGYLDVPALNLDQQGKYIFTQGVLGIFLQHQQQRKLGDEITPTFTIEQGQPQIIIRFKTILECYYTKELSDKVVSKKGQLKSNIPVKSQHLPGLIECFIHKEYLESTRGFISLLFLPIACFYFHLPFVNHPDPKKKTKVPTYALVIPEINNIQAWITRRKKFPSITYKDFKASDAGDSGLRFLMQEKIIDDLSSFRIRHCEVYKIGPQKWDKTQVGLKQAVYRVKVTDKILELYQNAYYLFPNQIKKTDKGETWLATSDVLPWIADNLITNKVWYAGFYEFRKSNQIYERKGLVKMTEYLTPDEQIFFDAIQGTFSTYLREQIVQAQKQGRLLDYKQVTDKLIYRLQRPNTQPEFATALVDILSRYRTSKARGAGSEIYLWLHRNTNWKQARDLALLAIATYTGKSKDGKTEIPQEVVQKLDSETESDGWNGDD